MQRYDQTQAECYVLTSTEGILSSLAHELRIRIDSFVVEVNTEKMNIEARFDTSSLHVECVIRDGDECVDLLDDEDRQTIDAHIAKDILESDFYEHILFRSTSISSSGKDYTVKGKVTLNGTEKDIGFPVRILEDRRVATITIHQPDFGIKPFSTMAGTIRVKPDVIIKVSIPVNVDRTRTVTG